MTDLAAASTLSAIQIITVPRSTNPIDWIKEKRTFSGHTAINVVNNGENIITEGFSPNNDLDMVLPVASYWLENILHHSIAQKLKGSKEASWQDDSPMLMHPKLDSLSFEMSSDMVHKFLNYFEEVKADSKKKYTLMPGLRDAANDLTEKNCVFSAINVLSDFLYDHQSEFSADEWGQIEPKLNALIEDTSKNLNTRQGHLNRNIAKWKEGNIKIRKMIAKAENMILEHSVTLHNATEMKLNEKFIDFIRGMSVLFDEKQPVSAQAIDMTELFINILDDTEETRAIKMEWAEIKGKYGLSASHLTQIIEKNKSEFGPILSTKVQDLIEKSGEILFTKRDSLDKNSEEYKEYEQLYGLSEGIAILLNSTHHSTPAFIDLTELYINSLDDSPEMTEIKEEWNEYKNKFGISPRPEDPTDLDLMSKQATNSDKKYTAELCSILQSGQFVEPGVSMKAQLYPNLVNLIKALQANDDFAVIKAIAEKGIEKNTQIQEQNPTRNTAHIDKRLTVFKAIAQANRLEEALDTIKHQLPEFNKEHDAGLQL
ncbi:hypothetical protein [Legionella bononiensis]|uniref:Uncharacterized protein n=1 Tax=Legionella bononiensis TaxID=2793102 RepID=A0ABS1WC26_9GAMM|nr:hypothetical protein [Legionella bononiensis]MBL7479171.1 hypothetical protein [Legionella bononiensis]MBL7526907.1 hypothetical protein [Legionella bononiensis]MBL7563821.1 hypothetical protein [Legionella bononiensis]